ncbi:MAG: MFS transporter [Candidatus Hodarchaeota archaeon]
MSLVDLIRAKKLYYFFGMLAPAIGALLTGFYTVFVLHYLSLVEVGVLFAFHLLLLAILDFPTGSLADMWGARKCLMISYLAFFVAFLGLGLLILTPNMALPLFLLIEFFFAVGIAQESGTIVAWFTNQCKANGDDLSKIRSIFGKARGITLMSTTIAMLIGGFLAEYIGIGVAFSAGIILSLLALTATSLLESESSNPLKAKMKYLDQLKAATKAAMADSRLPILITTSSLNYAGYFIVASLALQPLLYQDLKSLFWLSAIFALFQLIQVVSSYLGGKMVRFLDITTALAIWMIVPFLYLILFAAIMLNWGFYVVLLGLVFLFAVFALYHPHIGQFYQRLTPDDHRAALTSLRSTARSITAISFTIIGGIMLHRFGLGIALLIAGVLAVLSLGLLFYVWFLSHTFSGSPLVESVPTHQASPVYSPQAS